MKRIHTLLSTHYYIFIRKRQAVEDKSQQVDYIDRLFNRVDLLGKRVNTFSKWVTIISILLLLIAFKGIHIDNNLNATWINVNINPTLLIVVLNTILLLAQYYLFNFVILHDSIESELIHQYLSLSIQSKKQNISIYNALEYPLYFRIINDDTLLNSTRIGKLFAKIISMLVQGIVAVLPLLTTIIVFIAQLMQGNNAIWVCLVFPVLISFSATLLYSSYINMRNEAKKNKL